MTFHEWLDTYGRGLRAGGPVSLYEFAEAAWNASEDDCAMETHKMKEERDEARASNEVNKARALAAEDEAAKIRADNQHWIKRCAALSAEVEGMRAVVAAARILVHDTTCETGQEKIGGMYAFDELEAAVKALDAGKDKV